MKFLKSRAKGGLGLLLIEEQHRAIVGNLMMWIIGPGVHPLRLILTSHIHELSRRKWRFPDLTWLFTKGGGDIYLRRLIGLEQHL